MHGFAAALLIAAVGFCASLSRSLDGRFGSRLGRYSFPIYLIHLLVILSIGMFSFVFLYPSIGYTPAEIISIAISHAITIAVAHMFSLFEGRWIALVNEGADWILNAAGAGRRRPRRSIDATEVSIGRPSRLFQKSTWKDRVDPGGRRPPSLKS